MNEINMPRWQKELKSFIGVKSGIVLEGNILDMYLTFEEDDLTFKGLDIVIKNLVGEENAEVVFYDPFNGFYCYENTEEKQAEYLKKYLKDYKLRLTRNAGPKSRNTYMPLEKISPNKNICVISDEDHIYKNEGRKGETQESEEKNQVYMSEILRSTMLEKKENWKVFVLNFTSRMERLNPTDKLATEMFLNLEHAITMAKNSCGGKRHTIILVLDKDSNPNLGNIPTWIYKNNPYVKSIMIDFPDRNIRELFIEWESYNPRYSVLFKDTIINENKEIEELIRQTEGLSCREIEQILQIAVNEGFAINDIRKAIRIYKYGIEDSRWEELNSDKNIFSHVHEILSKRVKGQDDAIKKVETVIKRAIKGLSGLQHSNSKNKPRGVLFFAGPTGVGKTETAKAIAEAIFGDENAYIRFDMSEYRLEQSDQKLFGAPPGYVGYSEGGQLTNAIKNHPFSVILFDEIEKAHPTILDKFLQILEDGRMTDNQGKTVFFSESIIVFTSNIGLTEIVYDKFGMPKKDSYGNEIKKLTISIKNVYEKDTINFKQEVSKKILKGVEGYFDNIGRPELLNRLGENNIIVFQFIDKDIAPRICDYKLDKITKSIKEQYGLEIEYKDSLPYLEKLAIESREDGGRGIANMLEDRFINPLVDYLEGVEPTIKKIICRIDKKGIYFNSL